MLKLKMPFEGKGRKMKGGWRLAEGREVLAALGGVVADVLVDGEDGAGVLVQHDRFWSTFYGGLGAVSVQAGEAVEAGQVLGNCGEDGLAFELRLEGSAVDAKRYLEA